MNQQYLQIISDFEARQAVVEPAETSVLDILLRRLQQGSEWLTEVNASLFTMPDVGVGSEQEHQFCEGLAQWDRLEKELRQTYPNYTACILGSGQRCPAAATARCSACAPPWGGPG